ncbi:MAG: hypothetical protein EHM32_07445 [Spirochaetales bacterium]|nr:MAG: hypothetical protein EHM32_07445 [Spirochaetales bacterium]
MKISGRKVFTLIVLSAAVYLYCACVFRIGSGEFALVRDRESGERLVLGPGFDFVWQGVVPRRLEVARYALRVSEFIEARVAIPPLGELESDHYAIRVPVNAVYEIVPGSFRAVLSPAGREGHPGSIFMKGFVEKAFAASLGTYLAQGYDRNAVMRDRERIAAEAAELVKSRAAKTGISVIGLELSGPMVLPEQRTYLQGLAFLDDLREIEHNNKKELLVLQSQLEREKRRKKEYLEKLSDVSKLVKSNPDLLKYIYIDRLGDDVKVILTPEKSGMPLGLSLDEEKTVGKRKGEIDNLR